jgi:hypothetical protein
VNSNGGTGVKDATNSSYIGSGGDAGFEGLKILFDEAVNGGFEPGETLGFSIEMDPNSVAGAERTVLDSGSVPSWDVDGVSGAELIGSSFTVTFTDGTTVVGELQSDASVAGSHGLASQEELLADPEVSLTVNGLVEGENGLYDENGPEVIIQGDAGQKARVVLTKGFIQPVINEFYNGTSSQKKYAPKLDAQLEDLAKSNFPANNAVEFQTVDIILNGTPEDISELFDFSGVENFNFEGEDMLPLGFVASIVDPTNNNLPLGDVKQPIYLEFDAPVS